MQEYRTRPSRGLESECGEAKGGNGVQRGVPFCREVESIAQREAT